MVDTAVATSPLIAKLSSLTMGYPTATSGSVPWMGVLDPADP
jgi:hypothetical protein